MPDHLNSHVISSGPFGNVCDVYNDTGIKNANRKPVSKLWHPTVMTHKNSFDAKICKLLVAPIVKHVYHLSNRCWAKNMIAMPNIVLTVKSCTEMKCCAQHCIAFFKAGVARWPVFQAAGFGHPATRRLIFRRRHTTLGVSSEGIGWVKAETKCVWQRLHKPTVSCKLPSVAEGGAVCNSPKKENMIDHNQHDIVECKELEVTWTALKMDMKL